MIRIRRTRHEDVPAVIDVARRGFRDSPDVHLWTPEELHRHVDVYPEGQFVAVHEPSHHVVGSASSMRVPRERALTRHTWDEITGRGMFTHHDPAGDVLYGVDVCVHPRYRLGGVGKRLYAAREALLRETDCVGFAAGGRIPNYHRFEPYGMPVEEYVRLVEDRVIRDPVLGFQLGVGMTVLDVLPGYLRDSRSGGSAALIYLPNPSSPRDADIVTEYRRLPWAPPRTRRKPRRALPREPVRNRVAE